MTDIKNTFDENFYVPYRTTVIYGKKVPRRYIVLAYIERWKVFMEEGGLCSSHESFRRDRTCCSFESILLSGGRIMMIHMCQCCGTMWEDDGDLVVFCYQCAEEFE